MVWNMPYQNTDIPYLQDFVFPPEVALPIGGENSRRYIVIEMHYDNPDLQTGTEQIHFPNPCDTVRIRVFIIM